MAYKLNKLECITGLAVLGIMAVIANALPRTACPRKIGFDAIPDKIAYNAASGYYGASQPHEAHTMCTNEAKCVSFDNMGVRHFVALGEMVESVGACTYVKQACPRLDGYLTLSNKKWSVAPPGGADNAKNSEPGITPVVNHQGSVVIASQYCNITDTCLAWNDKGESLSLTSKLTLPAGSNAAIATLARMGITFKPAGEATCTYLKDSCPSKYGYIVKQDTQFVGATGIRGVRTGRLGSAAEAEEFCKISPKCTAWAADGSVAIGGIKSYTSSPGSCVYVKQPCPAVPGFTAHDGVTLAPTVPPDTGRPAAASFADLVSTCTHDPHCVAFDTLRHTWSSGSGKWEEPSMPLPGMCTFVRVAGLL